MNHNPVLIVDDNPINLQLASVTLKVAGYPVLPVLTAEDAETALLEIGRCAPRLILMDIQLPGMDGLELTRRLKGNLQTRHVIVVSMTAYAMKGDEERALAAGCDGYISKPIDTKALPGLLARFVERGAVRVP